MDSHARAYTYEYRVNLKFQLPYVSILNQMTMMEVIWANILLGKASKSAARVLRWSGQVIFASESSEPKICRHLPSCHLPCGVSAAYNTIDLRNSRFKKDRCYRYYCIFETGAVWMEGVTSNEPKSIHPGQKYTRLRSVGHYLCLYMDRPFLTRVNS